MLLIFIFYQYLRAVAVTCRVGEGDATCADDDAVLTAVDASFINDVLAVPPLKCFLIVVILYHYACGPSLRVQQEVGSAGFVILTFDGSHQIAPPLSGLISRRVLYLILNQYAMRTFIVGTPQGRADLPPHILPSHSRA